jgi:hypothetical protein
MRSARSFGCTFKERSLGASSARRTVKVRCFHDQADLEQQLVEWHREVNQERPCRATGSSGLRVSRSRCPGRSDRSASKSRSLNLAAFVQTLRGPQLDSVKAVRSMTPPSARLFASRETITGDSRGIRRRQRRRFYTSPRSPSRRYGCCLEATPTQELRRALLIRSSQTGTGRISASRLIIRPTRHRTKNPVNSSRTPNSAQISHVCDCPLPLDACRACLTTDKAMPCIYFIFFR